MQIAVIALVSFNFLILGLAVGWLLYDAQSRKTLQEAMAATLEQWNTSTAQVNSVYMDFKKVQGELENRITALQIGQNAGKVVRPNFNPTIPRPPKL